MIRKAKIQDIDSILNLIKPHSDAGIVLPRTRDEIETNLRDFFVYELDEEILGTVSLVYGTNRMAEIRSLAVDPNSLRKGIGGALVRVCIDDALELGFSKIFVLTYVVPLFQKLGFHTLDKELLPDKIWKDCQACRKQDSCDETAMIRDLVQVEVDGLPDLLTSGDSDPAVRL